ncbi:MAG: IS630 family transposase, partial [candidate division NC10 bacterium]
PPGSPSQLERRRRRALQLLKRGLTLSAVAERVDCSHSSVIRWREAYARAGPRSLAAKPPSPGRPPKLSRGQQRQLVRRLLRGPLACGYRTDLWTTQRVAEVIRTTFAVRYHPHAIWRVLRGLGWSCQKPERRALQRNEAAIAQWKRYRWPHIKKG